jgi:hypothetical protein
MGKFHGANGQSSSGWTHFLFWVFAIGGSWMFWSSGRSWRRVARDDSFLYVGHFFREVRIPLSLIEKVTMRAPTNFNPFITLHFSGNTPFGRRMTFVADGISVLRQRHPIEMELQAIAKKNCG